MAEEDNKFVGRKAYLLEKLSNTIKQELVMHKKYIKKKLKIKKIQEEYKELEV